jgi:hypothetical protein
VTQQSSLPIAVAFKEFEESGCPYCGYRSGSSPISGGGTSIFICGECNGTCAILAEGVTRSTIGFGVHFPELVAHPRRGIPKHGSPDTPPEQGGEHFNSRGLGLDITSGCFVCGGIEDMYSNIAAYVQNKQAGERVVAMFQHGAWLDYRNFEPDYVQVKIGACDHHRANLELLDKLTHENGGVITTEIVQQVTKL